MSLPWTERIADMVTELTCVSDDRAWRASFAGVFDRLRAQFDLHPAEPTPAATFEAAARATRSVAAECLPLGLALVMHLYPLCALRCVPLPWWSAAGLRRSWLLSAIDSRKLILANAGSERAAGAHAPVQVTRSRDGVHIQGTYDYVSLASVADIVLFSAPLTGSQCAVFCAADLRGHTVRIGDSKFRGSMRLSNTCPVSFEDHLVPSHRHILVPTEGALDCMSHYQRSWFQLLLGEGYLARIEQLQRQWDLPRSAAEIASLNELRLLREYSLQLLDDSAAANSVESLARVTAAVKLRISWHAQSTATALRGIDEVSATELGFFRRQPTSDDRILRSIGAAA